MNAWTLPSHGPDGFADRREAGERLAQALREHLAGEMRPLLVLALPRGGVPVAYEVALALHAPLELLFVRKIRAPGQPELGLGAVVDGAAPQRVLNPNIVEAVGASAAYIETETRHQLALIEERKRAYVGERQVTPVAGRVALLIDDGIATGGSMQVALKALQQAGAARVIVAVPVAPPEARQRLGVDDDDFVCLYAPEDFQAVGQFYADFEQTDDDEVIELLQAAHSHA